MYRILFVFVAGLVLGLAAGGSLPVARAEPVENLESLFSRDARGRLVLRVPKGLIIEGAVFAHQLAVTRGTSVFHQGVEVKRTLRVGEELHVERGIHAPKIDVDSSLRVRKGLLVQGPSVFEKDVELERGLKVKALEVTGRTMLRGDVTHERATRLQGDVTMRRTLTVEDLVVKDDASFGDDARIRGDLEVEGNLEHRR